MKATNYDLKFSIASRTIFSKRLRVIHWDGFKKATLHDFPQHLANMESEDLDGYVVHSVEATPQESDLYRLNNNLAYIMQRYPRHITRFEGSFEEFLQSLSSKTRSTLRRKVRKFTKEGGNDTIDWREYSSVEEMQEFLALVAPLAQRTYQAKLLDAALPSSEDFKQESLQAAQTGKLRAYLLFLQERPVAYLYTPLTDDAYTYEYLGYEDEYAHLSPGTVLQYLVHERLFTEKKVANFDFTEGDGAHKTLFANESTPCATVLYLKYSIANHLLIQAHILWGTSIEYFKHLSTRFKLQTRLRKLLR